MRRGRRSAARSILRQAAHSARTGTNHYHLKRVGDRSGCVAICDCSGHGCLPACTGIYSFEPSGVVGRGKERVAQHGRRAAGQPESGFLGRLVCWLCDCAAEPQTAPLSSPRAATRPGRDCSMLGKTPQRCRLGPARGWGTKLYRLPCTLKSVSGAGLHIAQPVAATGA